MKTNTYILIMAGGVGSRFWPKSREKFPKQFIDIMGVGKSLLQLTVERFSKEYAAENIYILTNQAYKPLVSEQLPQLPTDNILLEPSRNNTAPCIAYAGYKIRQKDPDAVMVVVPSDHIILKEEVFLEKISRAVHFAQENDAIITLGISPTRPDTGYGYIHYGEEASEGVHRVKAFMEKPKKEVAESYLQSGEYLWNAGMFIWKAETLKKALEQHAEEIHVLFEQGNGVYNTEHEAAFVLEYYPRSPNISIDYAVLEKADNVYTIPADIGWSDLGTWASLYEVLEKDADENAAGNLVNFVESKSNMVSLPANKLAVIRGLENFIVVDDGKVLLIYPKDQEQSIKQEAKNVFSKYGEEWG
jgi:mannose-1-phosphate guanylyltransferase